MAYKLATQQQQQQHQQQLLKFQDNWIILPRFSLSG
jgi:hypothetical protein